MFEVLRGHPEEFRQLSARLLLSDKLVAADFSNVARYYWVENDKEFWSLSEGDFPQCVPPWPMTWLEWETPSICVSSETGVTEAPQMRWGCQVVRLTVKDEYVSGAGLLANPIRAFEKATGIHPEGPTNVEPQEHMMMICAGVGAAAKEANGCAHAVVMSFTGMTMNGHLFPHFGFQVVFLDRMGDPMRVPGFGWVLSNTPKQVMEKPGGGGGIEAVDEFLGGQGRAVVLLGFSLANCSNTDITSEQLPRGVRRRASREGDPIGSVEYRTLRIRPMTACKENGQGGVRNPRLHICRGHFKDYRESGLFGQHKGVYWWESHLRGDEDKGRIHKTYDV